MTSLHTFEIKEGNGSARHRLWDLHSVSIYTQRHVTHRRQPDGTRVRARARAIRKRTRAGDGVRATE